MKMHDGMIFRYEGNEIINKIKNMPTHDEIRISLPRDLDPDLKRQILSYLQEITPKGKKRFSGIVQIRGGIVDILG